MPPPGSRGSGSQDPAESAAATPVLPLGSRASSPTELGLVNLSSLGDRLVMDAIGSVPAGQEVLILAGPRSISGAAWYRVRFPAFGELEGLGWVRLDSAAALGTFEEACLPDEAALLETAPCDRPRCLGARPVIVTGVATHCAGGMLGATPRWLNDGCWIVSEGPNRLALHVAPDSGIVPPDRLVRVRVAGSFDHPAAATCRWVDQAAAGFDPRAPGVDELVLQCREAFVVTELTILEEIGPPPVASSDTTSVLQSAAESSAWISPP